MADDRPAGDGAVAEDESKAATTVVDANAIAANRKAYLLSLVPDLTLDEIWMLQERLAKLDLRTDIFARLPPELQFMVADCLGPADLGCCLHVSCMWRNSFLHETMRKDLARRCFPSLLEYVDAVRTQMAKNDTDTKAAVPVTDTAESAEDQSDKDHKDHNDHIDQIFAETARKYALRALGRFRYVFRHCRNPPFSVAERTTGKMAGKPASELTASESTWLDQGRPLARRKNKRRQTQHQQQNQEQAYGQQYPGAAQYGWQPPRPYDLFQNRMDPTLELDSDENEGEEEVVSFHGTEYAHGRLAWQCLRNNDTWFLVDDLQDGRRLPLCVPNDHRRGESFLLVGFGDEILMAASGNRM